jgi:hypothetical protein
VWAPRLDPWGRPAAGLALTARASCGPTRVELVPATLVSSKGGMPRRRGATSAAGKRKIHPSRVILCRVQAKGRSSQGRSDVSG